MSNGQKLLIVLTLVSIASTIFLLLKLQNPQPAGVKACNPSPKIKANTNRACVSNQNSSQVIVRRVACIGTGKVPALSTPKTCKNPDSSCAASLNAASVAATSKLNAPKIACECESQCLTLLDNFANFCCGDNSSTEPQPGTKLPYCDCLCCNDGSTIGICNIPASASAVCLQCPPRCCCVNQDVHGGFTV